LREVCRDSIFETIFFKLTLEKNSNLVLAGLQNVGTAGTAGTGKQPSLRGRNTLKGKIRIGICTFLSIMQKPWGKILSKSQQKGKNEYTRKDILV